jgi:ankyrin repeat protein
MGNTARGKLHDAILEKNVFKAEKILDAAPEILNEASFKDSPMNPLIRACWGNDLQMVIMLCNRGANVNAMINNGHKPVYWCAIRSRLEILRYLIEDRKATYEVADMKGFTIIDHAIANGHYTVAKYLHDKGLRYKSLDFYLLEKDRFYGAQVDFARFLDCLETGALTNEYIFMKTEPGISQNSKFYSDV